MSIACSTSPGFGLGLRTAHYADFLAQPQPVDWLEIISDNFLVDGGKPLQWLERFRRDYPMAMHGVAMSIGSADGLDLAYLDRIKALAARIAPLWVSDHLCFTGVGAQRLHDLYPLPYTEECARRVIEQIGIAQDRLGRRLVLENVSSYVRYHAAQLSEWDFLRHVAEEADCELLVDVNNIYVSSVNHGFDPLAYLDGLPAERVRQIHLAGHSVQDGYLVDTHDQPVPDAVWALYAQACQRFGPVASMIERDAYIPPLADLLAELARARAIAARFPQPARSQADDRAITFPATHAADLAHTQQQLCAYVLAESAGPLPATIQASGPLAGLQGLQIYHHAYRARLAEVLADSYPKCVRYLGQALFDALAASYIARHVPQQRNLGCYGADFAAHLQAEYPHNPELADLAGLEWALRSVFDTADAPAWTAHAVAEQGGDACLAQPAPLLPSAHWLSVRSNALAIWQAIDADAAVPPASRSAQALSVLVWRKGLQPHFCSFEAAEADFLQTLQCEQRSIGELAEAWGGTARLPEPAVLAGWLSRWWQEEMLFRPAHLPAGTGG